MLNTYKYSSKTQSYCTTMDKKRAKMLCFNGSMANRAVTRLLSPDCCFWEDIEWKSEICSISV